LGDAAFVFVAGSLGFEGIGSELRIGFSPGGGELDEGVVAEFAFGLAEESVESGHRISCAPFLDDGGDGFPGFVFWKLKGLS
jgi:hypothetical protein